MDMATKAARSGVVYFILLIRGRVCLLGGGVVASSMRALGDSGEDLLLNMRVARVCAERASRLGLRERLSVVASGHEGGSARGERG